MNGQMWPSIQGPCSAQADDPVFRRGSFYLARFTSNVCEDWIPAAAGMAILAYSREV
jgi:hypothetical protein